MVGQYAASGIAVVAGYPPHLRGRQDYSDALGHFTREGAEAVARAIGQYYAGLDAAAAD